MTEDLTEKFKESFNNVENWVRENDKYAADGKIRGGNTCSKRVLSTSEAEELADSQKPVDASKPFDISMKRCFA